MWKALRSIFSLYTDGMVEEAERYAQIKSLQAYALGVQALRRISVFYLLGMLSCVSFIAGFFVLVVHGYFLASNALFVFDSIMWFGTILTLVSLGAMLWALSEKRWMQMFDVDRLMHKALGTPVQRSMVTDESDYVAAVGQRPVSEQAIAIERAIERALERRLAEIELREYRERRKARTQYDGVGTA